MDSNLEKVKVSIENLKEKKSRIYFFTQDVKNNPKGSVKYIYQMAMVLKEAGYNPIILHEKNDYAGVFEWLGEEYMTKIPHKSVEGQNLEISPEDFIILPEIYSFVMEQLKNMPCGKIVLVQTSAYMLETLQPGQTWPQFGFFKCLTTNEAQKDYIGGIMRNMSFDVVEPHIPKVFNKTGKPKMPIIAISAREHTDTANIIKSFYLKYPQYRFFTFRDMRAMSETEFSEALSQSCVSVWVDDESGFGTFPLESMACGTPVIAKIPDLIPEWMQEGNGIFLRDKNLIIDQIAIFLQSWLEDNIIPDLYENMEKTVEKYQDKDSFKNKIISLFDRYLNSRMESFEEQLNKLQ